MLFRKAKTGGFMDEIRCDEPSYLIWKWHPQGTQMGNNNRENAIRWGSSLRVKDGEVAVFVYNQKDGVMQDFIEGPYDDILKTANLPVLASIVGLAYDGGTPFQAEVYFINLARIIQVKFGIPYFSVFDPRFLDFAVPTAVRGTISFQIQDYREFIKLNRLNTFELQDFQKQIRDAVCRYVKDTVANAPAAHNIPVVQIETKIAQINDAVEYDLGERLRENFGVVVSGVDIGAIEIDKSSEGYQKLMAVTQDVATAKIEADTLDYVEKLRIQREEGQYALHKQTQTANIGAFQVEKQAEVGVAGAQALGQMGAAGAGDVNLGGGGTVPLTFTDYQKPTPVKRGITLNSGGYVMAGNLVFVELSVSKEGTWSTSLINKEDALSGFPVPIGPVSWVEGYHVKASAGANAAVIAAGTISSTGVLSVSVPDGSTANFSTFLSGVYLASL